VPWPAGRSGLAQLDVVTTMTEVIIIRYASPPPPLSTVVDNWAPLYFLAGLTGAWALVMLLVIGSFYVRTGSPGEQQPLQPPSAFTRKQAKMGTYAWSDADPEIQQQLMAIDGWTRAAFVRKVYAILSTQLLATAGIIIGLIYCAFVHGDPHYPTSWGYYIAGPGYYLSILILLFSMCFLCALTSCKNQYPINMIGLAAFTCMISFSIGTICIIYYGAGFGEEIMLAFILTAATFISLTLFTIFSKIDFEFLGPVLCAGIFVLMIWSLIMSIFFTFGGYSASWHLAFVIVAVAIFVGFIIYDTYMIVTRLGVDEYIIAAIELYLDVINLFLNILQLLVLCGGGRN